MAYACRGNYSYILKVEHRYQTMPAQRLHPDTTHVVTIVRSLAKYQNQQKRWPSAYSQLPLSKRYVFVPAGERDSSQGGSSVASRMQGQNSTCSSLLSNSCVADITQCVTSTPSATQHWSMNHPTATLGTSSHSTIAPGGISQSHSMCCGVSSPVSSVASTPTPLTGLENLPTPSHNREARAIITHPLRARATKRNQG